MSVYGIKSKSDILINILNILDIYYFGSNAYFESGNGNDEDLHSIIKLHIKLISSSVN
jgi:alpha-tubulin suppressor-like RCC1 family protein